MTTLTIRLSEEEKQKLLEYAEELDQSMSQLVRKALKEYLNSLEPKEKI
jgi:predicted transcriptional regulator